MKTVFVTGGIGSGKSALCRILEGRGIPVYDSDSRTKALYDTDPELIPSLETALQEESLRDGEGRLDRKKLASIIFSDRQKLLLLESIVHPAVLKDFRRWQRDLELSGKVIPFSVMESALVLEKPLFDGEADLVVLVDAPEDIRIERACRRDSASVEAVKARISSQKLDFSKADVVISNDSTEQDLERKAVKLIYDIWTSDTNNQMNTKPFQDITLSRLGMGNMRLPQKGTGKDATIDWEESAKMIDYCLSHGINYFDTAWIYNGGESEKFLGFALKPYPRDSYYIATKFNIGFTEDYRYVFETQLERLQTDHIDFYLLHALGDGNCQKYIDSGAIEYFLEQKAAGRITYLGFSTHASWQTLEKFADHHKWDFVQIQLNHYDWLYSQTQKEYEILQKRNIPIVVMEPVRGGRLASLTPEAESLLRSSHPDWSMAEWAFRFVQSLSQVQVILSGMSSMEQVQENVSTFSGEPGLSEEDRDLLFKACEMFHDQLFVPCTSCRYCCPDCPSEINIPEFLKVYNNYKVSGAFALRACAKVESAGGPKDCIGCGACASHCPQGIQIPDIMAEMAKLLQ